MGGLQTASTQRDTMHRHRSTSLGVAIALLLPLAGCGTGEYMNRMAQRAQELERAGEFETNLGVSQTVTPDVSLRIPAIFNSESRSWAPNSQDENGQTINFIRLQPVVCTLPGLTVTFERFLPDGDRQLPHYCYFASQVIGENQKAEEFKAAIEAEITRSGAAGAKFSPVTVTGPSGESQTWEMLSVTSQQRFAGMPPSGQEATLEGRFDLYFKATSTHFVLVGWRAPNGANANTFFQNARLAMGSATGGNAAQ